MAKKKLTTSVDKPKKFESSKVGSLLNNIITPKMQINVPKKQKRDYISTGNYLINASLSGSIFKGFEANRTWLVGGPSSSGKTYIAIQCCVEAQKKGYEILYIDTEASIDLEDVESRGINLDTFNLICVNNVEDLSVLLTKFLDSIKEEQATIEDENERTKVFIVLDSIGQMSSRKEISDMLSNDIKVDFTKAKALGALFRSISVPLSNLGIPMLALNHTYETMEMFSKQVMKGGNAAYYAASVVSFLTKAKLKDGTEDEMDTQSGITVTMRHEKNRLCKPKKIKFDISFKDGINPYSGLEYFCTKENFDKVGIAKGSLEVDKSTGEEIFKASAAARFWYVRHLDKKVPTKALFNSKVFNEDVLKALEPIIQKYFEYENITDVEGLNDEELEKLMNDKKDDNGYTDSEDFNFLDED